MALLADLVDLVLPRRCVGCGSAAGAWCTGCQPGGLPVPVAGAPLPTVAATVYADAVRAALLAYKERGRRDLAGPLAGLLERAVLGLLGGQRAPPARVVLVPVPSVRAVAAARGGDHVLRLTRRAAAGTGLQVVPHALTLVRAPQDSAGLGIGARAANLDHAMAAGPPAPGMLAVLVDDIVTTGATLREAARALTSTDWAVAGAAVVAATPRRSGDSAGGPLAALSRPD